jgi:hypothetical protein
VRGGKRAAEGLHLRQLLRKDVGAVQCRAEGAGGLHDKKFFPKLNTLGAPSALDPPQLVVTCTRRAGRDKKSTSWRYEEPWQISREWFPLKVRGSTVV